MSIHLSNETTKNIFESTHALLDGHFVLTSGLHSPNYFQCAKVLQYPKYLTLFSIAIANSFHLKEVEVVISPAVGGIVVGTEVGRLLAARTIFTERENGEMKLRRGFELKHGERVLVIEDVITTGGSINEVISIVKNFNAEVIGVASIVDRSNGKIKFDSKYFNLLNMEVVTYDPANCPLCKKNIPITKPGSRNLKV
ncbi:MAG: orotate phosphoribosyltransferase [Bacteroidetes bacterium]|nr:orotate phosphoribosyltransferase [Bacteroidota bacterium]